MAAEVVLVWPDNWESVSLFVDLTTQWRIGMSGPTGLDYSALRALLGIRRVPRSRWSDLFDDLRVLEQEALEVMKS